MTQQNPEIKHFCFGGHLFGWTHADGYAAAEQQAPDAWLLLFEQHHCDAETLARVFSACKGGRDWALRRAKGLRLHVDLPAAHLVPAQWDAWQLPPSRLAAIQQSLAVRGNQPSSLSLLVGDSASSVSAALSIAPSLQGSGVRGLDVTCQYDSTTSQRNAEAIIQGLVGLLPQLNTLTTRNYTQSLPTASAAPSVTSLNIHLPAPFPFYVSYTQQQIATLLPQLRSLSIHGPVTTWIMFAPARCAPHLTHLHIQSPLDHMMLRALLRGAPALRHLHVSKVAALTTSLSDRTWCVEELTATQGSDGDYVTTLFNLPRRAEGRTVYHCGVDVAVSVQSPEVRAPCTHAACVQLYMHAW